MSRTLVRAGMIVTMDASRNVHHQAGLLLEGERITGVGPWSDFASVDSPIVDLSHCLVMPGLVNAHTHTPMVLFRGLAEGHSLLGLTGWYNAIRVWELHLAPEMIPPAVAVSCAEMIRTGTTCFADQYFYMDQILPVVERSGLRAALAYGIVELGDTAASAHALRETEEFLQQLRGHDRLKAWVGPHALFADNCAETIRAELELASRFDTGFHIHLSTTGEEDRVCLKQYGRTAVQQMKVMGLLERPMIAAHSLHIPAEDWSTLADAPFTAIMIPSSCTRSGVPAAPLRAMQAAGVKAALGTDNVANNNSYDLFADMGLLGKLMSYREKDPGAIPADRIVEMSTLGGARALGLHSEIGSLEAGKRADWIALNLEEIGWAPRGAQDVYTALVYAVSGLHVRHVMVNGRWLLRDGKLLTLDYSIATAGLEASLDELRRRRTHAEQAEKQTIAATSRTHQEDTNGSRHVRSMDTRSDSPRSAS